MPMTKDMKRLLYLRIFISDILLLLSIILMNPTPGQMIFGHMPFHWSGNNIAALSLFILAILVIVIKRPRL
jgi:hypothetical protein